MRGSPFLLAALMAAVPLAAAHTGATYESFEEGWGAWHIDADVWCLHEADPCTWDWQAFRAPGIAFDGAWGVTILQDGLHDSGTVWVERQIAVPPGERVELSFWVFSPYLAPTTAWQARAYIGTMDPELEWDLEPVGALDHLPGWHRYCLSVPTIKSEALWVAAGTRAAWESGTRLHAIDQLSVRGASGGEPCGILEDPCHVAGAVCTAQKLACETGACPQV